jgi:hypothetical protein
MNASISAARPVVVAASNAIATAAGQASRWRMPGSLNARGVACNTAATFVAEFISGSASSLSLPSSGVTIVVASKEAVAG